ncbi:hypothetical protein [Nitrococcus mobilis]|uniref:Uncharacterized protein n=1 Tax=Nitrococcus mobilis Nb-231 TaxID=314278 RepID=A4BUP8_9GAMM|nr:hypothetical protein [Nitrococcus mobilis]EAR20614.1 hypothetical protein NB231_07442 [Nitrococcus mobilis Nb-231]
MKHFLVLAMVAILVGMMPAYAENAESKNTNMQILIDKAKADKKYIIASNMDLTDSESKDFWPLYEGYQKELDRFNSQLKEIINEYADAYNKGAIPDRLAKKLMNESLNIEGAEARTRREYAEKMIKVLPAAKVARYLQMERKIRSAIKFDLAANIPLVY